MLDSINNLIEALRDELEHYGEMLALLDRQQGFLMTRAADEVSQSIHQVQAQGAAILKARQHRELCRSAVAQAAGEPDDTSFASLIPILPADYRPLLQALVDENNELLSRVRRRARQNHLMLIRSVELMQQLLNSLCPSTQTPNAGGRDNAPCFARAELQLHQEAN